MPTLTSLYLCNRTVYAAVGTPAANGATLTAVCQDELPEGCLINGVITNESDLAAALRDFMARNDLPAKRVALCVGGSQFQHKLLTLPAMSEKKRYAVLAQELSTAGVEADAPLDDYQLLRRDAKAKTDTVFACRVESAVVESYAALAKDAGFTIHSLDYSLSGQLKLVAATPALAGTFVVLQFDGDTLLASLYEQGVFHYASRSRLFYPRGTAESGSEIAQKLSGLVQFHIANKGAEPIAAAYFGGCTPQDLAVCRAGCEGLGLSAEVFPDSPNLHLPDGVHLADAMFAAGNLIAR